MNLLREADSPTQSPPSTESRLSAAIPYILFTGILFNCLSPFRSKLSWMVFVQDDFFYYLKIAQNFAQGNGSTFNGIVPTNGYHPLWFLLLAAFSRFTTSPRMIIGFVAFTSFAASVVTYLCASRLIRATGMRRLTSTVLAAWLTIYALRLFLYGMEATLAIPLSLSVICIIQNSAFWLRGWKQSFVVGLVVSAMILSRLDTMIFAGLILIFILVQPRLREQIRGPQIAGIALGLVPVVLYLLLNHAFFHVWLPVSGMAKQLKFNHHPTLEAWRGLYLFIPSFLLVFLPIPVGILLYPWTAKYLTPVQKALYPAALFFPLIYFFVLCCLSDWSIWPWYMYAFRPAMCVAFVIFCTLPPLARLFRTTFVTVILLLIFTVFLITSKWRIQEPDLYAGSVAIQKFSQTHPGIYAMGDRAGRVGYLMNDPVIHLEGLVMDRPFLSYIQRQTPLREVLNAYHVRYYIGTAREPYSGCFQAVEPFQAGPESPHMRDVFCEKPIAVIDSEGAQNPIFDLHPEEDMPSKP